MRVQAVVGDEAAAKGLGGSEPAPCRRTAGETRRQCQLQRLGGGED